MEVVADDQGRMGLENELNHTGDVSTYDQDDEFDLTIGGEEDLDPNAGRYDTNGAFISEADENEITDETLFNYEAEERGNSANVVLPTERDDRYNGDVNNEMLDLNVDTTEATGSAIEMDESTEIEKIGSPFSTEAAAQAYDDKHAEVVVEEEVYYHETGDEFETFDNTAQPQHHVHDHMEHATSVDNVSGNEEVHSDDLEAKIHEDQVPDSKSASVEIEKIEAVEAVAEDDVAAFGLGADEPVEDEAQEEQARYDDVQVDDGKPMFDDNDGAKPSSQKDSVADLTDEPQDQESWDETGDNDEASDIRPKVTVSYQSQEYSMFAESPGQDPDLYFLADLDSLHQPLSQLLANIRDVISDEIAPTQEVFLRVNGLGFEFAESTTKDFLDETTLAHIIEVNKQLIANEGGSPSPILHCYLGLRPSCLHRFSELSKAADEGKGLSDIAMFYDDASMDESAEDNEEHDFSQDIISDGPSLDEAALGDDNASEKGDDSNDAEQYWNPFRTTEEQFQTTDDVAVLKAAEGEPAEYEDLSVEALGVDNTEMENAVEYEDVSGNVGNDLDTNTAEALNYARDLSGQSEGAYDQPNTEDAEVEYVEQHAEMQTNLSQEDQEHIDGKTPILSRSSACGVEDLCLCFECLRPQFVGFDNSWSLVSLVETQAHPPTIAYNNDGAPTDANVTMSSKAEAGHESKRIEPSSSDAKADTNDQEIVANPTDENDGNDENDDDYLDLGNDEGEEGTHEPASDSALAFDNEAAESPAPIVISPQTSQNSSATATLDGNDNGAQVVASINRDPVTDSQNEAEFDASSGEVDEIDWNHDEEGDIDDANQNPTALSPSSPSAKRNREEDENADGPGDENGGYYHVASIRMHANPLPAIKRRRT